MFRFSIRDVLWLTAFTATLLGWWLENTPRVAKEHYLRVTDADYDRATLAAPDNSAGTGAGIDAQEPAQGQAPAQSGTPEQIVRKVLEQNSLDATTGVVS